MQPLRNFLEASVSLALERQSFFVDFPRPIETFLDRLLAPSNQPSRLPSPEALAAAV